MSDPDSSTTMRRAKPKRLLIASLILLAGGGLLFWSTRGLHRRPLHKGKPISYWVDQACRYDSVGSDGDKVWQARLELQNLGSAAVPYLVDRLRVSDRWRNAWLWLRPRLPAPLQRRFSLTRSADEIRYGAVRTLSLFGADAKSAVPDLVRLLPHGDFPVIETLAAIGPDAKGALPVLQSALTNRDISVRVRIASALWYIGRETNCVLQICTNALVPGIPSGATMNAGALLGQLGAAAAPAAPFALAILKDTTRSAGTRGNAATVLGVARVFSDEIRAALLDGTKADQEQILRSNCAMALWGLDQQYAPLGTRLALEQIVALKKQFPSNEQDFSRWLKYRGLDPQDSIPTLKQLLTSDSADMSKEAALALERIEAKTQTPAKP